MASTIKIKRSASPGNAPNNTNIDTAELALNTADRIMYSSDGTDVFEIGANLTSLAVSGQVTLTNIISANGSVGTAGQVLLTDGSSKVYWGSGGGGFWTQTGSDIYYNTGNVGIGTITPAQALDVSGNIAVSGTVDGRDVATDGTKLDGIESGATADQTAAEILIAIKTVDGSGSGLDADTLDGQQGSYYAPIASPTLTGTVTYTLLNGPSTDTRDKIRLWPSPSYAIGMGSGYTFGALNDFATTFQMNDDADRGWWWGDTSHTNAQGSMSLTTIGELTVAKSISIPGSETATSGTTGLYMFDDGNPRIHGDNNLWINSTTGAVYINNQNNGNVILTNGVGNVGIGISSPLSKLDIVGGPGFYSNRIIHVAGDINPTGYDSGTSGARIGFTYGTVEVGGMRSGVTNGGAGTETAHLVFSTANSGTLSEKMRITSSGNVGIGTTAPTEKLSVAGRVTISTSAATTHNRIYQTNSGGDAYNSDISASTTNRSWIYGAFDTAAGFSNGGWCIYDATAATYRVVINSTGNVGIGTSSPAKQLHITKAAIADIGTLTDGATITPNFDSNQNFTVTLGGNRTLANPSNIDAGQTGSIFIVQDGTGGRTLSFGTYWDFPGGTAPTLTSTAGAVDRIDYIVRTTTSIHAVFTAAMS